MKPVAFYFATVMFVAGAASAQQQMNCQRQFNQTNCTITGTPASRVDTNAPWQNFAQQQAAQQAASAQMISAQAAANAQVAAARIQAQAQVEAARIQSQQQQPETRVQQSPPQAPSLPASAVPPAVPLENMSPEARRSTIAIQAGQATTENLQGSITKLDHLCEVSQAAVWCDAADITRKELSWRAAHRPLSRAEDDAATEARIEAREKRNQVAQK